MLGAKQEVDEEKAENKQEEVQNPSQNPPKKTTFACPSNNKVFFCTL
jgi:hypothetical protein